MNYFYNYINLIEKARKRKLIKTQYYEKHHIIPKSIFNNKKANNILNYCNIKFEKEKQNIVSLSPREHFIAHMLLVKIFYNINTNAYKKMLYAANFLSHLRSNNKKVNSKTYAFLRREFSKMMSKEMTGKPSRAKGCKWSKERHKIGQIHLKNKTYEEIHGKIKANKLRQQRSDFRQGKTLEEIYGVKDGTKIRKKMINRVFTKEWREKISKAAQNRPMNEITRKKISDFMSNDLLNPSIHQQKYIFENIYTREQIIMRKHDMKKKYGCSVIHKVIRGERKHNKGWCFIKKYQGDTKDEG